MLRYIAHRCLVMVPTLLAISALVFIIIQLPPGDYLETMMAEMQARGESVDPARVEALRRDYGLDRPIVEQYFVWIWGCLQGDFGWSFEFNLPVADLIGERMALSVLVSASTLIFIWVVSFAIGIYTALRQYSLGDHLATFMGYIGLATPDFLLALVLMYFANLWFDIEIGGIMDQEFIGQPWTADKLISIFEHMWIPVIVIGTSGTAGMIRRLRANLLDELQKQYVVTARAKGLPEGRVIRRYPLRMAINPFIADIGNILPDIVSGVALVSIVMNLETTGKMMLTALRSQDMYLAGTFLMFLALLTVIGTLISDLALAALDPRIRLAGGATR